MNRLSPAFFSRNKFTKDFHCSCFRRVVQDSCLRCPGGHEGSMCPVLTYTSASHLAGLAPPSRLAVRRPTRPARGVSVFWVRQVGFNRISFVRAVGQSRKTVFLDVLEGKREWGWLFPGRTDLWASRPAPSCQIEADLVPRKDLQGGR